VPQRVKDRTEVVRMNACGDTVKMIAAYFGWHLETIRNTLNRWQKGGLGGLWEAPGRGKKRRWHESDMEDLEQVLVQDQRTYNSTQLSQKLQQERQVSLSPGHIRRVLKTRG